MPTIDISDAEHTAVTALIKRAIEEDRFQRLAPRPLRLALAKLDPAAAAALRRPLTPKSAKPGITASKRPPTALLRPQIDIHQGRG
jgi:hypothetical protein